jgi:hypothetical protein
MRLGVLIAGLAILAATPAAATIPLTGELYVEANASVGATTAGDFGGDNWSGSPFSLSAGINANVFVGGGAAADAGGDANWASADAGDFNFDLGGSAGASPEYAWSSIARWYYSFTAESDGTFNLDYAFSGVGADLGEASWVLFWSGPGGDFGAVDLSGVAPGTVSRTLQAGQSYEAQVAMSIGAKSPSAPAMRSVSGDFAWSIGARAAPVPEPATWALLISGFGLTGSALRRRARVLELRRQETSRRH